MEQRFIVVSGAKKGAVAAIAVVKGSFYDKQRKAMAPTSELLAAMGWQGEAPEPPNHIVKWQEAEDALRLVTKE